MKPKFSRTPRLRIIDQIGYLPIDRLGANLLYSVIGRRCGHGPMMLTRNASFAAWSDVL